MPNITLFFTIMVFVSCIGQVSSDLYLPSLPAIASDLNTSDSLAKLSVSVFMLGYSLSQLIYGPISDALGRRKPLLFGITLCVIASIVCVFAPSIHFLITARLFQGLGSGCGLSLSRSMIRDRCEGADLAKYSSYLGILNVFVVASAPVVGGYLEHYWGWRASFIALTIYALMTLMIVIRLLPETSKHIYPESLKIKALMKNFSYLLTNRQFIGYSLCVFLTYGSVLAWVTISPMLLQKTVGLSAVQYGWVAISVGLAFIVGGVCNALLINRFGHLSMLRVGISIQLLAGFWMLYFGLQHIVNLYAILGPLWLFLFGCALIFPNCFAGALTPFEKMAGIASALFGFMQILGGSLSSFLMSYLPDTSQVPIASAFVCYAITALFISIYLLRR